MTAALDKTKPVRGELVQYEPSQSVTLFRTEQPEEIIARATDTAKALSRVVKKQKLTTAIQGRDHVRVEGWTLLGTMLGVFPVCVWTRKLEDGWEARVEARTLAGQIVGAAEAQCLRGERTWASRDDYALRSMAQTRATSKALRQPLGFVMTLAGFDATPAEEMPVVETHAAPAVARSPFDPPVGAVDGKATPKQIKYLDGLIQELTKTGTLDAVSLAEGMQQAYGTSLPAELSVDQATNLIDRLKLKKEQAAAA